MFTEILATKDFRMPRKTQFTITNGSASDHRKLASSIKSGEFDTLPFSAFKDCIFWTGNTGDNPENGSFCSVKNNLPLFSIGEWLILLELASARFDLQTPEYTQNYHDLFSDCSKGTILEISSERLQRVTALNWAAISIITEFLGEEELDMMSVAKLRVELAFLMKRPQKHVFANDPSVDADWKVTSYQPVGKTIEVSWELGTTNPVTVILEKTSRSVFQLTNIVSFDPKFSVDNEELANSLVRKSFELVQGLKQNYNLEFR